MGQSSGCPGRSAWAAFASFETKRLDERLEQMFKMDFPEAASEKIGLSQEDQRAQQTNAPKNGQFEIH